MPHPSVDLAAKTRAELLELDNFGEKTLQECRALMKTLGVKHPNWNRPPRRKKPTKRKRR